MSTFGFSNILMMERTARLTATNGSGSANAQIIPTITASGKTIRPIGLSIIDASADFELEIGTADDLGDQVDVTAADLAADNQLTFFLGEDDIIVIDDGAGTATVDVRWLWPNKARDGSRLGAFADVVMPVKTAEITAVLSTESEVSIPEGATQLVIYDIDANTLLYRVDDGSADGQQLSVVSTEVTMDKPYVIHVNDGDRLRVEGGAVANSVLGAYWRIAR